MATQPNSAFNPFSSVSPLTYGNANALVPTDANGNPITTSPYSNVYGTPAAAPAYVEQPNADQAILTGNTANYINQAGQQLNQEAQGNLAYESALQSQYQGALNQGLNALAATPGYTPGEAGQINVDYSQFNTPQAALQAQFLTPAEQASIAGNPNQPVGVATTGTGAEGQFLNETQSELGGTLSQYASQLGGATGAFQQGTTGAAAGLQSGLTAAQGGFGALNTAVNNPALAFDPNATEKQITDAQVQQMATNAGEVVGSQYRTAEDQLQRQAAAAGNTSPLAIAAANARLQQQSAAGTANAVSSADIAALQAQEQQATSIEQQREGAAFQQTGLQAGAATTEEEQAQAAAGLAGTQNIAAQEAAGEAGINAANTTNQAALNAVQYYGGLAQGEASTAEQQNYNAAATAEQEAAARAATLATNRQATQANVSNTAYAQGTGSQQLTSQGAQAVGNARITGQNTYLGAVGGAASQAQQGGQAAMGAQQSAYGTQTSGLVSGTSALGSYRASPSTTAAGETSGILGGIGSLIPKATGGVITKPTLVKVGESGPEAVVKLPGGRYRRKAA
jgi:trimeric autotransporter adhesin